MRFCGQSELLDRAVAGTVCCAYATAMLLYAPGKQAMHVDIPLTVFGWFKSAWMVECSMKLADRRCESFLCPPLPQALQAPDQP